MPCHAIPAGDGDGDDDGAKCASASVHTNIGRIGAPPPLPPPLPPPPRGVHLAEKMEVLVMETPPGATNNSLRIHPS